MTAWHNAVVCKLFKLKFNSSIIKIIQSFLSARSFRVYVGSKYSSFYQITAGCLQGSCLSPILYNLFTSDVPIFDLRETSIFADDTAILCSDFLANGILHNLQQDLNKIHQYLTKWKIALNVHNTQAIYFTRKRKICFTSQSNIKFNHTNMPWESKVKYLGIILDRKLTFRDHIQYITSK